MGRVARKASIIRVSAAVGLFCSAALLIPQIAPQERVGPLPGGGFLLNSGWRLQPAGTQIPLDTFPMSAALAPDGKFVLVLNAGYQQPSISVIEAASARVVSSAPVADGWMGLAFAPKTNRVYVGGGARSAVFEFIYDAGKLTPGRTFTVVPEASRTPRDFIGDVAFSPDGRQLLAADLYRNSVVVINPQSGIPIARYTTGRRPYRVLFHPDGKSFFVTHWADGSVGHYDAATGSQMALLRLGAHPTDIIWREGAPASEADQPAWAGRLFVAAAHTNTVYSIGVTSSKELKLAETINIGMSAMQPLGMTPSALELSADAKSLYVACSGANSVAVVDLEGERSRVAGFIPTGWYPTAVRALPSGGLLALSGKGAGSQPNPGGPNPARMPQLPNLGSTDERYVARLQKGAASLIAPFNSSQLEAWTKIAIANSPYSDMNLVETVPLPRIEHVVYILKEGRTYDSVFGGVKPGNGEPSLAVFGEEAAPNHHRLARQFVLLDNFYASGDTPADGYNWSTAAMAPDYVERLWPNSYGGRRSVYDYEQGDPASLPPAGYLWTNATTAGVSIRNFGHMVENRPNAMPGEEQVARVRDPVLAKFTNRFFRGFDLDFPDTERAKVFLAELAEYEKSGTMPRLIVMRLGNDHTYGTQAGRTAPQSMMADNDAALGSIVEAISRSGFWANTAIFVVEASAHAGSDHVDSHRAPAFLISPYAKRGAVDSAIYNTASMLRTIELLLGLRPMTHFDAAARPLTAAFQGTPDTAPYQAEKPRVSLTQKNQGPR